ncbi:hypothetical protein GCM10009080_20630 [Cupriavidus pauculus]
MDLLGVVQRLILGGAGRSLWVLAQCRSNATTRQHCCCSNRSPLDIGQVSGSACLVNEGTSHNCTGRSPNGTDYTVAVSWAMYRTP